MVLDSVHDAVVELLDYNRDDEPELLEPDGAQRALESGDVTLDELGAAFVAALREQLQL